LPEIGARPSYLALSWDGEAEALGSRVEALSDDIEHAWPRLDRVASETGFRLWRDHREEYRSFTDPASATIHVVGAHFSRQDGGDREAPAGSLATGTGSIREMADRLLARTWGSYLAFLRVPPSGETAILREPSGALRAFILRDKDLIIVSPVVPKRLFELLGRRPRIDADLLAVALRDPTVVNFRSLVEGVAVVPPGGSVRLGRTPARSEQIWQPQSFVSRGPLRGAEAAAALREDVILACRALSRSAEKVAIELSGGLDSAIVLGALAGAQPPPELTCVNYATGYAEGNERGHARAAAGMWNARLVELDAREGELDLSQLELIDYPIEPILYGLDLVVERATSQVAQAVEADLIATGQAGDAVFFQLPTRAVATDYLRAVGPRAFWSEIPFDLARRTSCSIWRVWGEMLFHRRMQRRWSMGDFDRSLLGPACAGGSEIPRHPWLEGAEDLPPAKRLQLEALCNCHLFYGPTFRSSVAPLVHPLMSQPVLERCLMIPAYELARGPLDRPLARSAFKHLLPQSIANRRGKGEASAYYGRAVSGNLPFLRSFLLDGTLAEHGFIDREALNALLDTDTLAWSDKARLPIVLASFEAWARYWEL
jgi:asparagine synthase (glutamine-hydrolysing)